MSGQTAEVIGESRRGGWTRESRAAALLPPLLAAPGLVLSGYEVWALVASGFLRFAPSSGWSVWGLTLVFSVAFLAAFPPFAALLAFALSFSAASRGRVWFFLPAAGVLLSYLTPVLVMVLMALASLVR